MLLWQVIQVCNHLTRFWVDTCAEWFRATFKNIFTGAYQPITDVRNFPLGKKGQIRQFVIKSLTWMFYQLPLYVTASSKFVWIARKEAIVLRESGVELGMGQSYWSQISQFCLSDLVTVKLSQRKHICVFNGIFIFPVLQSLLVASYTQGSTFRFSSHWGTLSTILLQYPPSLQEWMSLSVPTYYQRVTNVRGRIRLWLLRFLKTFITI